MAKTKLLAEIAAQSDSLNAKISVLNTSLGSAASTTSAHFDALTAIKTDVDNLDRTVGKLEARMKSWDGSTKLRDIFKKKAPLATARQDAIDKAKQIRADVAFIHSTIEEVIRSMQQVSRAH